MRTIYYGGDIITMKNQNDFPEALVTENGKILFTGTYDDAEKQYGNSAEKINLQGHTLMPSFIDAHSHFSQVAQSAMMCDLSETKDFHDIAETLNSYMQENGIDENGVIFASGYDHNFLKEERHPDKTVLDEVSKTVPIYISHASGHMGVANSALLALAGITDDTKNPEGGKFGRNEDGSLNGYVEETPALMKILTCAMPRVKPDMAKQMAAAQELYFKYGITTVQEGAAMGASMQGLVGFSDSGALKLDVVAYILEEEYDRTVSTYSEYNQKYKNCIKIGGAKIILDGSPQGKSAWLSKPYEGEKDYCGYPTHDNAYVENAALRAVRGNYQLLAHCNGDAASQQFLDSYKKALETVENPNMDLRPVMIHCQTVREDQLDTMAELKMIPSLFIGHTYYWGDIHLKNLGPVRGTQISPAKSALERGLVYNFHQDTPVTKPDMLHSVWCAVNRMTRKDRLIGQNQCISVYEALQGVTINAAYEYKEEDKKGTLEPGKLADMVILSSNPLKADNMHIKDITILETIKEGITLYRAK